jgi:hypothetical protein
MLPRPVLKGGQCEDVTYILTSMCSIVSEAALDLEA